jgi:tetratricopeptide (TPR) repeat protein
MTRIGIHYYQQAIKIHPTYDDPFLNMGAAYTRIDSFEKAEQLWNHVREHAAHPKLIEYDKVLAQNFYKQGMNCGSRHAIDSALFYLNKSTKYLRTIDSTYLECWYNVGGANFTAKNYEKAYEAFEKVIKINPNYRDANNGYNAAKFLLKK